MAPRHNHPDCGFAKGAASTVDELAKRLDLTDNAVRAHLATLERDGLVRQQGVRRGLRKPHYQYSLTLEAEQLFPKAYDAVLNQLISVLKARIEPGVLEDALREVGRSMGIDQGLAVKNRDVEVRVRMAAKTLEAIGGSPEIERCDDKLFIRSGSCPLAAAVTQHPEVCAVAEALVSQIVGARVRERCDRAGSSPKCCFEIAGV